MPKDTFFNLPKNKQDILMKAARNEFARATFDEASINQIIKEAKIARGSFYMYFESKEDLYFYLLEEGRKNMMDLFLKNLKEHQGDLVEAFTALFEQLLERHDEKKDTFFRNVVSNTSFRNLKFVKPKFSENGKEEMLDQLYDAIDTDLFAYSEKEILKEVFRILQMETVYSLMIYFKEQIPKEEAIFSHKSRMNLLKHGIYKR